MIFKHPPPVCTRTSPEIRPSLDSVTTPTLNSFPAILLTDFVQFLPSSNSTQTQCQNLLQSDYSTGLNFCTCLPHQHTSVFHNQHNKLGLPSFTRLQTTCRDGPTPPIPLTRLCTRHLPHNNQSHFDSDLVLSAVIALASRRPRSNFNIRHATCKLVMANLSARSLLFHSSGFVV